MEDIRLNKIINHFYTSNTYIISNDKYHYVWLVDCGDYNVVKQQIQDKKIKGVFLTHTHIDHIYGLNELLNDFPSVIIYTNEFGKIALSDSQLNISKYHNEISDFAISSNADIISLIGDEILEIFPNVSINVISTPGHDKSCLSYVVQNKIFTGDSYIPSAKLVASFPNSNKKEARLSYNKLKELSEKYIVFPGHG